MREESLPFLKIEKKCLDFWKIGPDCIHLWVTFYIQNIFLRVSKKKLQNVSLWGLFLCFWRNIYQSEPFISLANLETCHIQNPGIFRTKGIFSFLSRHILAYSECHVTLKYWESCHIQDFALFRILECWGPKAYSESCLYRHIQIYSDIFKNDSYNNIHFLFFTLILHTFSTKFKKTYVSWLQWRQCQCSTEST